MKDPMQIFTFLFLMLGPFKIIAPFAKITQHANPVLTRQIAIRATLFSSVALLLAAILGENILSNFGIPIPILAMSGGIILFLVALLNIIRQFDPPKEQEAGIENPTLNMGINPLAFPTIVTPYGVAAVIVFLALAPDLNSKLIVGAIIVGIMVINLVFMLITRHIFKPLALILSILGAILGIVQVALGLMIIYSSLKQLLNV